MNRALVDGGKEGRRSATPPRAHSAMSVSHAASLPVLMRKEGACACGGGCPRCQQESRHPDIQTKLAISSPGDQYEQEADRVADQIMRMTASHSAKAPPSVGANCPASLLQRKCADCEAEQEDMSPEGESALQQKEITEEAPGVTSEINAQQ